VNGAGRPARTIRGLTKEDDQMRQVLRRRPVLAALGVLVLAVPLLAAKPIHRLIVRTPGDIPRLLELGVHRGSCDQCHTQHGDYGVTYDHALVGPDDNTLCDGCHAIAWAGGSYAGAIPYLGSAHGNDPSVAWPGPSPPARTEGGAAGKCLNCHDPHGWEDGQGLIPMLAHGREEALCLACHDGAPAAHDVRLDQTKPYRHPTQDFSGRHTGPTEATPADFGATPLNRRHAECADCHNPHLARGHALPAGATGVSKLLLGVSRLLVTNGAAGTAPGFARVPASDTLTAVEGDHPLCFKCHSSWTTQPGGQTDLARVLNPNNPSFHPVEAPGANPGISPLAFASGWTAASRTACGSCHGSDDPLARGPHGSLHRWILRAPYDPDPRPRPMDAGDLCFSCHAFDVYANQATPAPVRAASRFNRPGMDAGHTEHVGREGLPCGACHVTHGSTTLPALLVTGRTPGIVSVTVTPAGGTCSPTCHAPASWTANYAR
jgi:predicted CXXCH cytochrome family protein